MTDLTEKTSPVPSEGRLSRGEVVSGRFVVESPIGSGGMGQIYLAYQRPFNRPVALKVMHREATKTRELVERFFQEASTVSHLAHPNTVTVYDFGRTDSGQLYIAMELVDGISLGDEIKRRRTLPADEAIPYTIQIAQSLGEAHHKGLVHRDLKPDNVMLCRPDGSDAFVKVLDFGIAKVLGKDASWTEVGNIVGTPFYMAPEQAKGMDVDARTDLYSLGCCLFEMLTGDPPYVNESPVQVLMAHQNSEIPDLPGGFHPALNDFMKRALAKNPNDRPDDSATFVAELLATIIEMRANDSYSGYTPSPASFDRETRRSPIPLPSDSTPQKRRPDSHGEQRFRNPLFDSGPKQPEDSGHGSRRGAGDDPRTQLGRNYESDVATADTVERPISAIEAAVSPKTSNPWKWLSLSLGVVVVASAALYVATQQDSSSSTPDRATSTEPAPAISTTRLEAVSEPEGAVVYVGDTPVGKTPLSHEFNADGEFELRFTLPGYVDYSTTVTATDEPVVKVFAPLERAKLSIRVTAAFDGTELYIDERSYGSMRAGSVRTFQIPFPTEELMLRLEADGYQPLVERFDPAVIDRNLSITPRESDFVPTSSETEE